MMRALMMSALALSASVGATGSAAAQSATATVRRESVGAGRAPAPGAKTGPKTVSYTHLTLPTNREV